MCTAGLTYCAIGALTFLNRFSKGAKPAKLLSPTAPEFESLVRWLVARQTSELGDEPDEDDTNLYEKEECLRETAQGSSTSDRVRQLPGIQPPEEASLHWAGFNGRCNKTADTCYSFWNVGTLAVRTPANAERRTDSRKMMDRLPLVDADRDRRYLLEKTQHAVGGFGKAVGEPPGSPVAFVADDC